MRSDLRGMAGLDAQRRRPDSSSQLNTGSIPTTPRDPSVEYMFGRGTGYKVPATTEEEEGDAALLRKTSAVPGLLNMSECVRGTG